MHYRSWISGSIAAASLAAAATAATTDKLAPSQEIATQRGPEIFNAVHNAMRQWGSSLHHNGMSFFLATVPQGVLLHHGNGSPDTPTEPDWLAYEIEHAEHFARGSGGGGSSGGPPPGDDARGRPQHPMVTVDEVDMEVAEEERHGYLHVYQTTRPLRYIYTDGMGGGKTTMGTLDAQDLLLRGMTKKFGKRGGGPMDENLRAVELCELCKEWGLEGIIRMEAGFEIIHCDFSSGLQQVQALQRPVQSNQRGGGESVEFIRGLSERYQGIGSSRTIVDYSSMVSAFFFPVNLTNSDPKRPDLPRLNSVEPSELAAIKSYLTDVITELRDEPMRTIDWQDVSDLIVGRYADRIKYMAEQVDSTEKMAEEIDFLLTVFVDGSGAESTPDAIDRCANFYVQYLTPVTEADRLIKTAFQATVHEICDTLFRVRSLVVLDPAPDQSSLAASTSALRSLMTTLNWTRFKKCPACAINEVCLIPMWPFGTVEDYNHPRCTNGTNANDGSANYWGGRGGPGGGGSGGGGPGGGRP
ncbi:hypothetical protein BX600DRAFT_382718 [Xylariales sp. PMI_506]|nr:hypothetical protein BX600DRAFT_382718 [Xylariales sp. PMI_506]